MQRPRYRFENDEHHALSAQARRFAEKEIAPHAHAWEKAGDFPRVLYQKIAAAGLLGVGYDEALGGAGGDLGHLLAAQEELIVNGTSASTIVGLFSHTIALPH